MIRTFLMLAIAIYSLSRLVIIGSMYYLEIMILPTSVVVLTIICSILTLLITLLTYVKKLSGKKLRLCLFIFAVTAIINMVLTYFAQPGMLSNWNLIITGTFFDIIVFLIFCTIKIRNTR